MCRLKQSYVSASRTGCESRSRMLLCTESASTAILAQRLRRRGRSARRIRRDLYAKLWIWFRENAPRIIVHVSQTAATFTASYLSLWRCTSYSTSVHCIFLFYNARFQSRNNARHLIWVSHGTRVKHIHQLCKFTRLLISYCTYECIWTLFSIVSDLI